MTHLDEKGNPGMVNVGHKAITRRLATARTTIRLPDIVMAQLNQGEILVKKGPVIQTAQLAGVMGVKRTSDLIPLCHPLPVTAIDFQFNWEVNLLHIDCTVQCEAKTGVEMEALTGSSIAALTIYDMCKALSHEIVIERTELIEKRGGKSDYRKGTS